MSEFSLICVTSVGKPPITFVKHDLEDLNCLQQTRLSVDLTILDPPCYRTCIAYQADTLLARKYSEGRRVSEKLRIFLKTGSQHTVGLISHLTLVCCGFDLGAVLLVAWTAPGK